MKATAKTKTKTDTVPALASNSQAAQPSYQLIPGKDLVISPTNPRRRINQETIRSLAESIRTQNVLEPLIVRQKGEKYEIVCGERRYRSSQAIPEIDKNGNPTGKTYSLPELPCIIRELSDEQVLDIQIHENLHREDVHPMDEAYSYQFLKEKLNCETRELALRIGKSEGYVLGRLKLNLLIKEAQKDIDEGYLPLTYALEISKYTPEIQKYIYSEVYKKQGKHEVDDYVYVPVKGEMVPWKTFIDWINTNIHRMLSKAPFDPKATNLREDGLACEKCPDRTGAAVSLFEPNQVGKKDACLNPACFMQKAKTHVEVRRGELAELRKVEPSEVPIVRSWCYSDGKDYRGTESAKVISGAKRSGNAQSCDKGVSGIDIDADNFGQTVQVCLKTSQCNIHWPESRISSNGGSPDADAKSAETEAAERLETHRARREEIWNAKVAESSRLRVFKLAAETFETQFSITDVGTDLLPQLLAQFWRMTSSGDSSNLNNVIKRLISEWEGEKEKGGEPFTSGSWNAIEQFTKLDRTMLFRILFLLIHAHKGAIGHGNNYRSQREVRELASEFDVDYSLIDAEVRVNLCPKKHLPVHNTYLDAVRERKEDVKVPRLFSERWKPAD